MRANGFFYSLIMWLIRYPVIDEKSEFRKQLKEMKWKYKELAGCR